MCNKVDIDLTVLRCEVQRDGRAAKEQISSP
jgi:hypothetical protein